LNLLVENQTVKTLFQSIAGVKPAVVSRQPRIANIERLRIISAFGVASFHTHDWYPRSIGMASVIILLLSFCAFVVNKPEPYGVAKLDSVSANLALLSYGIYLVRPLVLVPLYHFGIALQHPLLLLFLVLSISLLITFILRKTPLKQFV